MKTPEQCVFIAQLETLKKSTDDMFLRQGISEYILYWQTANTEPEDECNWTQEDWDSDMWSGSCGACWSLNDGTPEENDMKYCTNCGKRLVQHIWQQEDK